MSPARRQLRPAHARERCTVILPILMTRALEQKNHYVAQSHDSGLAQQKADLKGTEGHHRSLSQVVSDPSALAVVPWLQGQRLLFSRPGLNSLTGFPCHHLVMSSVSPALAALQLPTDANARLSDHSAPADRCSAMPMGLPPQRREGPPTPCPRVPVSASWGHGFRRARPPNALGQRHPCFLDIA